MGFSVFQTMCKYRERVYNAKVNDDFVVAGMLVASF